jgi:hypothetical protein
MIKRVLATLFISLVLLSIMVALHEVSHKVVFESYGCTNITFAVLPKNTGAFAATIPGDCSRLTEAQYISMTSDHNIVDIITYNIGVFLFFMIVIKLCNDIIVTKKSHNHIELQKYD